MNVDFSIYLASSYLIYSLALVVFSFCRATVVGWMLQRCTDKDWLAVVKIFCYNRVQA